MSTSRAPAQRLRQIRLERQRAAATACRAGSARCSGSPPCAPAAPRSRPHRRTGRPLRANWIASAVPHEPAPSTATGASRSAGVLMRVRAAVRCQLVVAGVGCWLARVQRVEVHRRQQELREAALGHQLRDRRARVREQHARAELLIARLVSSSDRLRITNRPACFTSTRKIVASPYLADTVTVSTTSRTSGVEGGRSRSAGRG